MSILVYTYVLFVVRVTLTLCYYYDITSVYEEVFLSNYLSTGIFENAAQNGTVLLK
jgi:hypothetical protein